MNSPCPFRIALLFLNGGPPHPYIQLDRHPLFHHRHHPLYENTAVQPFTDEAGAPATLPEMGNGGEESKMKVLLGLLRK
jgi:hypothetical protein